MNGDESECSLWSDLGDITLQNIEEALLYDPDFITQEAVAVCENVEMDQAVQDCDGNATGEPNYDPEFITQEVMQVCENAELAAGGISDDLVQPVFCPDRCSTPININPNNSINAGNFSGEGDAHEAQAVSVIQPERSLPPPRILCSGSHIRKDCGRCGVVDPITDNVLCPGHLEEHCQSLLMEEPIGWRMDNSEEEDEEEEEEEEEDGPTASIYSASTVQLDNTVNLSEESLSSSMEVVINGGCNEDDEQYISFDDYSERTIYDNTPESIASDDDLIDLDAQFYYSSQDVTIEEEAFEDAPQLNGPAFGPQDVDMEEDIANDTIDLGSSELNDDGQCVSGAAGTEEVLTQGTVDLVTPQEEHESVNEEDEEEEDEEEEPSIIMDVHNYEDSDDDDDGGSSGSASNGESQSEVEEGSYGAEEHSQLESSSDQERSERSYNIEEQQECNGEDAEDLHNGSEEVDDVMEGDNHDENVQVGHGAGGGPLIEKLSERPRWFEKFQTNYNEIQFQILPPQPGVDFNAWIYDVILAILDQTFNGIDENDRVGMEIEVPDNTHATPFCIAIRRKGAFHPDVILDQIAKMSQSNQLTFLQGTVKVNFLHSVEPNGGGVGQGLQLSDDHVFLMNKQCVLSLAKWATEDENCLPRALVIARMYLRSAKEGAQLHKRVTEQRKAMNALCRQAGVPLDQKCGMPELRMFSEALSDYNIRVYTDRIGREVMYEGNPQIKDERFRISLYYSHKARHYAVIKSMTGFTGRRAYCYDCRQAYSSKGHHVCKNACRKCFKSGADDCCPPQRGFQRKCSVCQFTFYNMECFRTHKERPFFTKGRSVCEVRQFCTTCLVAINIRDKKSVHDCTKFYCSNCKDTVAREGHVCTIQVKETLLQRERRRRTEKEASGTKKKRSNQQYNSDSEESEESQDDDEEESLDIAQAGPSRGPGPKPKKQEKKRSRPFVYVIFDLETRQEKQRDDGSWEHEANLCVSHTACSICMDEHDLTKECVDCGKREQVFRGNDCVTQFMSYMFNSQALRKFRQVISIAHNLLGFDGSFVLSYLCDRPQTGLGPPTFIQRGTKLINICYGRFKFVDSLNFLPMGLAKLPKALDLGVNVAKGWFPHFFNTAENQDYKGPIPAPEMFGVDKMGVGDRAKFEEWYRDQTEQEYDFAKQLVKYCISDVDVLRRAVIKFRALWLKTSEIDPFRECNTLAGARMLNFQANYLTRNSICIIPRGGFFGKDVHSKAAVEWLRYKSHTMGVDIQHAQNATEHKAGKYRLDGFIPGNGRQKPQALEFQGCYFYGHPACFPFQAASINDNETMGDRYRKTLEKRERLEALGYKVIEMWECEWARQKKEDAAVQTYLRDHPVDFEEPLNPRDCFYGGRCNNVKRYFKVSGGQKIHYVDVTSLYPFINKFGKYVLGAPTRKVYPDCPHPDHFEGLIKLTILPPQDLYHPVLPLHMHGKLMFILCRTCGEECKYDSAESCGHTPEERMIKGSWVVDEVRKALEMGYEIVKIHECWIFDQVTKFDPSGKPGDPTTSGLFAKYVNANLRLKTEASGWPPNVKTPEEKDAFLKDQASKGVVLNPDNMIKNPGLRAVAKLCLNSLWGRFAMGSNLKKTVMITEAQKHYEILNNPGIRVHSILPINDDIEIMSYDFKDEEIPTSLNTNVVIAAYTTALARLELYKYLEKVQEDALYFDTDSLIYLERPGITEKIQIGNDLGEMTDELHEHGGPDSYATHFVSGGPKVYGLKIAHGGDVNNTSTIIKVKGISMNSGNKDIINFEQLCKLVLGEIEPILIKSHRDIRRAKHYKIVSRDTHKYLRPVYTKRRWAPDYDSIPYGFKRPRIDSQHSSQET